MEYTVIIKDRSYDLPDKTLKVVEDMDTVVRIDEKRGRIIGWLIVVRALLVIVAVQEPVRF
nr:MAG TPA: hypothetical protein [Caudoviricetes sp.]